MSQVEQTEEEKAKVIMKFYESKFSYYPFDSDSNNQVNNMWDTFVDMIYNRMQITYFNSDAD